MECMLCRHQNGSGARFCESCGTPLLGRCPRCGVDTATEARFCAACGQELFQEGEASTTTLVGTEGERRHATVMFCDLTGYTTMGERLDPEVVEEIVSRIKMRAVEIVERHGGTVSQFQGDGLLVLFGVPVAHDDDPVRAVRAARALHTVVRTISPEIEDRIGQPLRFHSGISSGLIVTSARDSRDGAIGVTGDTVNLAARLAAKASPDEILVGPDTQRQIEDFFETAALTPMALKGKSEPVVPHRIVRETANQSRFEAAERRGLTRFTGRQQELQVLQTAMRQLVNGEGSLITVEGDPGMGKSRLAFEFRHGIDRAVVNVLEGRCQSHGSATPYRPFIDAMRRGLQLRDDELGEGLHQRAVTAIRSFGAEMEAVLPQLLHLLSIPSESYPLPANLEGAELRESLELSILKLLEATTRRRPAVLILEDWHWADDSSESTLQRLISRLPGASLLVIVLYRPESAFQLPEGKHHIALVLRPLTVGDTNLILRSVLSTNSMPVGFAELVHERTAGNPFFAEEIAVALRDQGHVVVEHRQAKVNAPMETLDLPETVQATIRARVDRLSNSQRHVLKVAAVLGREFRTKVLATLLGKGSSVSDVLAMLAEHDLVQVVRTLPEPEYMFKHVLIQAVVYDTLLRQQRKNLHARAGEAIEALYANRLEEYYEALAYHYAHSAESDKAIQYLSLAGDKAAGVFSLAEARKHYREAIGVMDTLVEVPKQERIDLTLKWAEVSHYSPSDEHIKILDTSRQYAQELQDDLRLARVIYWTGRNLRLMGRLSESISMLEQCIALAEEIGDEKLLPFPYNTIGRACFFTAEYPKGIEYMEKGIAMMESLGNMEEVSYSCGFCGDCYGWTGNFPKGFSLCERSLELAKATGDLSRQLGSYWYLCATQLIHGSWEAAKESVTKEIELANRVGAEMMATHGIALLGWATFMIEDSEKGLDLMRDGCQKFEATGTIQGITMLYGALTEACAVFGSQIEARKYAQKTFEIRKIGEFIGETVAYRGLAISAAQEASPQWAEAEKHMKQSIQLCQERQTRPDEAIAYFRWAEICHKRGELDGALDSVNKADVLFSDMGMPWWSLQNRELRHRIDKGGIFKGFAPVLND